MPKLSKPVSKTPINILDNTKLTEATKKLYAGGIPEEFKPTCHPEFCKCATVEVINEKEIEHFRTEYEPAPRQLATKSCLWLPFGASVTNRAIFSWRCRNNNPKCEVFYDGVEDGIFNYSNKTLVATVVLLDFLLSLVCGFVILSYIYDHPSNILF